MLGDEDPRQGDVRELARVGEIVLRGQILRACPIQRLGKPALCEPHPHSQRRDRADVRDGAPDRQPLRLVELLEGTIKVALNLAYTSPSHALARGSLARALSCA